MTTVFIDTNIYRKFGLQFRNNQDFIRLQDFLDKTYNEFGLLEVVRTEFIDFIQNEVFKKLQNEYNALRKNIEESPFFKIDLLPDLNTEFEQAITLAIKELDIHKFKLGYKSYGHDDLIRFLLVNKKEHGKKDNTRDFLIFSDLISFSLSNDKEEFIFISEDAFFTDHRHVQEIMKEKKVKNLHFFKSISDFLKEFGPHFDFVTEELVLESVAENDIKKEILRDIESFPGYISYYLHNLKGKQIPKNETLDIKAIKVHDFYVTKNLTSESYNIQFSLAVSIKAVFEPIDINEVKSFISALPNDWRSIHQETFDSQNRPIFDHKILFIYEGQVDEKNKQIVGIKFLDFFIDHFLMEEYKAKYIAMKNKVPQDVSICSAGTHHNFDIENGFYHRSQYGGGLSWHYRCKSCGTIYDTGEYYD